MKFFAIPSVWHCLGKGNFTYSSFVLTLAEDHSFPIGSPVAFGFIQFLVFVSQDCCNKVPKSDRLKIIEMYCLSLKPRDRQGHALSNGCGGGASLASSSSWCLAVLGISWLVNASSQLRGCLLPVCLHTLFLHVPLCLFFSPYKNTNCIGLGPTFMTSA